MKKRFLILWICISALANVWLQEQIFTVQTYMKYYREDRREELRCLAVPPPVTRRTLDSPQRRKAAGRKWTEQILFSCMGTDREVPGQLDFAGRMFAKRFIPKGLWTQGEEMTEKILRDFQCFPVAVRKGETETLSFENSWGGARDYGGSRRHEGCDIMTSNNKSGYFDIVSVSDGVVEKMGWLELGGYRVGVRSESGVYYYYAHLDSYREGLREGMKVRAGDVLGKMGDTGYGEEGTRGKFDVHLHFGIYMDEAASYSVNPFFVLDAYRDYTVTG